jgi:hypothetical protein
MTPGSPTPAIEKEALEKLLDRLADIRRRMGMLAKGGKVNMRVPASIATAAQPKGE